MKFKFSLTRLVKTTLKSCLGIMIVTMALSTMTIILNGVWWCIFDKFLVGTQSHVTPFVLLFGVTGIIGFIFAAILEEIDVVPGRKESAIILKEDE